MKTVLTLLAAAALCAGCAQNTARTAGAGAGAPTVPATASSGFGNERSMRIDGQSMRVNETSARLLGNEQGKAALLVDDITDGQGPQKAPGYKLMLMNRTYSVGAEARAPRQDAPNPRWGDAMHMHRGVKLLVGIPVVNGRMDLAQARLLSMAVVSDANAPAGFKAEDKIRPLGEQLVHKESRIAQPRLVISELRLPNVQTGESAGGGVRFEAEALIDGKRVHTSANSAFTRFETASSRAQGAFKADARFLK